MYRVSPRSQTLTLALCAFFASVAVPADAGESPASASIGRDTFRSYCATCHGADARGNGPLAEHLRIPPANLTTISQRNGGEFPSEEVHKMIRGDREVRGHGSTDMPVWGDVFSKSDRESAPEEVERKIADLVAYLLSIQAAGSPAIGH